MIISNTFTLSSLLSTEAEGLVTFSSSWWAESGRVEGGGWPFWRRRAGWPGSCSAVISTDVEDGTVSEVFSQTFSQISCFPFLKNRWIEIISSFFKGICGEKWKVSRHLDDKSRDSHNKCFVKWLINVFLLFLAYSLILEI